MDIYKPVSSLIDSGILNSMLLTLENQQANKDTIFWYKAIVGLLMYVMTMIRPDLRYVLSMVSQYYRNSNSSQVVTIIQILRYVRDTLYYGLIYTKGQPGFCRLHQRGLE